MPQAWQSYPCLQAFVRSPESHSPVFASVTRRSYVFRQGDLTAWAWGGEIYWIMLQTQLSSNYKASGPLAARQNRGNSKYSCSPKRGTDGFRSAEHLRSRLCQCD